MDFLEKLLCISGASGSEQGVASLIENEVKSFVDEMYKDSMGNLIAHKKGNGKKLMLAAHMDEIGVIATYITDNGFVRFASIGGLAPCEISHAEIIFNNGVMGVICKEENIELKDLKVSNLYIDIGAENRDDAQKLITVGQVATFYRDKIAVRGKRLVSKALDDRIGCYVIAEVAKKMQGSNNDMYFVFTVQEELGLRGAKTAAYTVEPDFAIAVDVTDCGQVIGSKNVEVKLSKGPAIKICDKSVIASKQIVDLLTDTAKENNIPYQLEAMGPGGTDAGAILVSKAGVATGGLCIPCRNIHSPVETVDLNDVENAVKLLCFVAKKELK